jgi:predicted alpha/beta superfamily hydrolase
MEKYYRSLKQSIKFLNSVWLKQMPPMKIIPVLKRFFLILSFVLVCCKTHGQEFERYKTFGDTLFFSTSLGFEKKISIMVPKDYQPGLNAAGFPLIIIFDTQNKRSYQYIQRTIDYLTSNEQMPACIVLGVESAMEERYAETQLEQSDSLAFGSKTEQFIFDELIPYAKTALNAMDFKLLIGHSRYGYFTTYLLTKRPNDLNAVISLSPFFKQKNVNLVDSMAKMIPQFSKSNMLYYRFGIGNDYPEDFKLMLDRINFTNEQYPHVNIRGTLLKEAGHNVTPGLMIATALYEIFEFWSSQQNAYIRNETKTIDSLGFFTEQMNLHYGAPLKFSLGTLNGKGWYFFNEGEYKKAIQAWEKMMEFYPNFSEGYLYMIYALKELKQDYSSVYKKLEQGLTTTRFYTEDELKDLKAEIKELEK